MPPEVGAVLPYRTDVGDLLRLLEALSRGRPLAQLRAAAGSAKNFEGTLSAAQALALVEGGGEQLSERGREVALAAPAEQPQRLLQSVRRYPPYARLFEAIFAAGGELTPIDWVERWWTTHGYGSSASNRAEAATTLARIAEQLGLANYVAGRRGHPSRLQWRPEAARSLHPPPAGLAEPARVDAAPPADAAPPRPQRPPQAAGALPPPAAPGAGLNDVTLELRPGVHARLQLPVALAAAEKRRLLALLDLLIRTEE